MLRKTKLTLRLDIEPRLASMGPELICSEKPHFQTMSWNLPKASMGPELICSGKRNYFAIAVRIHISFNGAGADMLRKTRS